MNVCGRTFLNRFLEITFYLTYTAVVKFDLFCYHRQRQSITLGLLALITRGSEGKGEMSKEFCPPPQKKHEDNKNHWIGYDLLRYNQKDYSIKYNVFVKYKL